MTLKKCIESTHTHTQKRGKKRRGKQKRAYKKKEKWILESCLVECRLTISACCR